MLHSAGQPPSVLPGFSFGSSPSAHRTGGPFLTRSPLKLCEGPGRYPSAKEWVGSEESTLTHQPLRSWLESDATGFMSVPGSFEPLAMVQGNHARWLGTEPNEMVTELRA